MTAGPSFQRICLCLLKDLRNFKSWNLKIYIHACNIRIRKQKHKDQKRVTYSEFASNGIESHMNRMLKLCWQWDFRLLFSWKFKLIIVRINEDNNYNKIWLNVFKIKNIEYLQTGNNLKLIFLFFFSESSWGTLGNGLLSKSFAEAFLTGGRGGLSSSPLESMIKYYIYAVTNTVQCWMYFSSALSYYKVLSY